MIEIEKGVPIPPSSTARSEFFDVMFKMDVGDSILIRGDRAKQNKAKAMTGNFKARYRREFTTRRVAEGLRIWRTK